MSYDSDEVKARFDEDRFANFLESLGATVNRPSRRSTCPVHRGNNQEALSFKQNGSAVVWRCFVCCEGGTVIDLVMQKFGKSFEDAVSWLGDYVGAPKAAPQPSRPSPPTAINVTRNEIRDADGNLVAVHIRREFEDGTKKFSWERDGKMGLGGVPAADLPLFGSERAKDWPLDDGPIFLNEGEKKTLACLAHGLRALGTVTGASSTPAGEPLGILAGRHCVLIADNDAAGKGHMGRIAEVLLPIAASVRVIALGDGDGYDAANYFDDGGKADELVRAALASPMRKAKMHQNREGVPSPRIELPECAWLGPLADWRRLAGLSTEAPAEFLWVAFLTAVSVSIGRRLWCSMPLPIYPNVYTLLTGPTGAAKKTTVLRLARVLIECIGAEVSVLPGISSAEGLADALADREGVQALLYLDELGALRTVANRKGTANILPALNTLYDCPPEYEFRRRGEGSTRAVRPLLSVIAAAPSGQLSDLLTEQDTASGFVNRFCVIAGEETQPKPRPQAIRNADVLSLVGPVKESIGRLGTGQEWTLPDGSEVADIWDSFYQRCKKRQKERPNPALTERTHVHALKYAMILGVICGDSNFTPSTLKAAIEVAEVLEAGALQVLGAVGQTRAGKGQDAVIATIRRLARPDRWAVMREVQRALPAGSVRDGFRGLMFDLEKADLIELGSETSPSGQKRKLVRLTE